MSEYNARLISRRESVFQKNHDPSFSWKTAISMYANLPGLVSFWPMSSVGYQTSPTPPLRSVIVPNHSGHTHIIHDLFYEPPYSVAAFGYDGLIPYATVFGSDGYLRIGILQIYAITGTEPHIEPAYRGLTLGIWVQFSETGKGEALIGKADAVNYAYYLEKTQDESVRVVVTDGLVNYGVESANTVDASQWHLVIGRWTPSTEASVFLNGVKTVETANVPATLLDSVAHPYVGYETPTSNNTSAKRVSMAFICTMSLSDTICQNIWHQSRAMFGR
jgi:hypothetical protein